MKRRNNQQKKEEPPRQDDDFLSLFNLQPKQDSNPKRFYLPSDLQVGSEPIFGTTFDQEKFSAELNTSMRMIPDMPFDFTDYKPKTPEINKTYPQIPNMALLQPEMIGLYDVSILLYIFYCFPNSQYQFFAAKELKKRGWDYCINSTQWVHLISAPLEETDSYIIGKYEVFDPKGARWNSVIHQSYKVNKSEFENE